MFRGLAPGVALRRALPDLGAVIRAMAGVVLAAALSLHWLGTNAAIAAVGASAVAGAVALQDSPLGSFRLVASVSVALGAAVALGGVTEPRGPLFAAVVAVWGFGAGMTWAVSANAGAVAAAATALLVVTPSAPSWPPAATAAGVAVAGGLVQAVLIAAWPKRRWRVQRAALTRAYLSLADDSRKLANDPAGLMDAAPLARLRETFTPAAVQGARRPQSYRTWYGLPERIADTLTALAGKPDPDGRVGQVLLAAAEVFAAVAETGREAPRVAGGALAAFDAAAAAVTGPQANLVHRLSIQLREAVGLRWGEPVPTSDDVAALRRSRLPIEIRSLLPAVRRHLHTDDPVLRHAVRLSVAATIGASIARFADIGYGYWIPLTVVMALRPETAHTYTRCVGRIAGTAGGIAVASAFVVTLHPTGLAAAAFTIAFLAVAYLASSIGFVAVSAALATALVFLMDVGGGAGPTMLGDRLLATLIGGVVAVLAHVVLPDHAVVRLRQRAGELLKTEMDYAATVVKAFVHELDHRAEALSSAWERAYRARAAFEAAAGASPPEDRESRRWLRAYRTGLNAVTASCSTLESGLPAHPPEGWGRDFVGAVDEYAEALRGDPATPGSAWHADVSQLTLATERVRTALPSSDATTARVLVGEMGVITNQVIAISAGMDQRASAGWVPGNR